MSQKVARWGADIVNPSRPYMSLACTQFLLRHPKRKGLTSSRSEKKGQHVTQQRVSWASHFSDWLDASHLLNWSSLILFDWFLTIQSKYYSHISSECPYQLCNTPTVSCNTMWEHFVRTQCEEQQKRTETTPHKHLSTFSQIKSKANLHVTLPK